MPATCGGRRSELCRWSGGPSPPTSLPCSTPSPPPRTGARTRRTKVSLTLNPLFHCNSSACDGEIVWDSSLQSAGRSPSIETSGSRKKSAIWHFIMCRLFEIAVHLQMEKKRDVLHLLRPWSRLTFWFDRNCSDDSVGLVIDPFVSRCGLAVKALGW